ncbi:MAG TPA: hypothetical protein VMJ12_08740 [Candidatus Acidoferrales bacterium]|nr:hypothetical protein [Candidatus Acidoferrales bacterium]
MRAASVLILGLALASLNVFGDEKLPVLTAGGETYSNVTVIKVSATDIYFISDKGLANTKLKNLSPAWQQHFHYNPAAAQPPAVVNTPDQSGVAAPGKASSVAEVRSQMENAEARVREIVNQPVTSLARTPDMQVATYSPGWFHPGAEKPDFDTVDVRTTQTFPYDEQQYVTSDLNPDVVFIGSELEFNPMTKYFYTDRTVPKKKLTEEEMVEINRLYRTIGKCERQLDELQNPASPVTVTRLWVSANKPIAIAAAAILFLALLWLLRKRDAET